MSALTASRAAYAERLESGLARVVEALRRLPEVRRISVFGSYARGRRDLFTDLDILVVMDTQESFPERLARLYALLDAGVDSVDARRVPAHACPALRALDRE